MPAVLFVSFFLKVKKQKSLWVIFIYSLFTLINELTLIRLTNSNPILFSKIGSALWSIYTIVEYSLFSLVIYHTLKNKILKNIVVYCIPLFIVFTTIIYFISKSQKDSFDSISITVEYIILILFTLLYFYEEISIPKTTFIYASFQFWNIVGILIYSTGTFFLFMYSNSLGAEDWENWSIINYVFTLLKNLLFSIAIIVLAQNHKDDEPERKFFEERINYF